MRKFIENRYLVTAIILSFLLLVYLTINQGGLDALLDNKSILIIIPVSWAITITLYNGIGKPNINKNAGIGLSLKLSILMMPLLTFFLLLFIPNQQNNSHCEEVIEEMQEELITRVDDSVNNYAPDYLREISFAERGKEKAIKDISVYQQDITRKILRKENIDRPCRRKLENIIKDSLYSRITNRVTKVFELTTAINKVLRQKDTTAVDQLMQKFSISKSADLIEYSSDHSGPGSRYESIQQWMKAIITDAEIPRNFEAVFNIAIDNNNLIQTIEFTSSEL